MHEIAFATEESDLRIWHGNRLILEEFETCGDAIAITNWHALKESHAVQNALLLFSVPFGYLY